MSALDAALGYVGRGWAPIPIPFRSKAPTINGWQKLRIGKADAQQYFNGTAQNIGVLLGTVSGDLVDADLDCREALGLAPSFLPRTESVFGRAGKQRSHWLYTSSIPKRIEFTDPDDGETLLELRSTGGQTVFPGSTHESGEEIDWSDNGEPTDVDPSQLTAAAGRLAAACVLVRAAPAENRHAYLVDVSGALVRGLGRDGAASILAPVARLILGDLYSKAEGDRLLGDTARKLEAGKPVSGWPKLAERIGEKRARKLSEWLNSPAIEHGGLAADIIIAAAKAKEAPQPARSSPGIAYDADLVLQPGGILQELAEWMTSTSKRKQPILALGGATALVGLLCAHGYRILHGGHDTRSNVLIVGLAASGSGKDHSRRCVKAILAELGMAEFVGEDLASGQALEGAFIGRFANLFLVDEYGHRLAAALNPKGNPNERKLVEVITKLSTSAAGPYTHTRLAINRHVEVPITFDPCLVGFCTTVEAPLWAGMQSGHLSDGSIARHLFLKTAADYPDNDYDAPHFEERLPEMVAHARRVLTGARGELEMHRRIGALSARYRVDLKTGASERQQPTKPVLHTVPIDGGAKAELRRLDEEELALLREHQHHGTNALVGRLVEHTSRLALICAVSDNPAAPVLSARHVLWGEAMTKRSLDTVLAAVVENVADTDHHANRNKLLRDTRRASGGAWITRRDVARGCRSFDARTIAALLSELIELGLVERRGGARGGQRVEEFRCT